MLEFSDYSSIIKNLLSSLMVLDINGNLIDNQSGFQKIIEMLTILKKNKNKIMIIGNGGSAAIASHLQNDLSKGSMLRAQVFTEQSLLTALSNDICYAAAYPEQLRLWAEEGDILYAISSSGQSENILTSSKLAREIGCYIITLSGFSSENPLKMMGDLNFYINSNHYGYVEVSHTVITHYISDCLAETMKTSMK
jgi:D-sedoheptulose 7-phosphate isomerase